MQNEMERSGTIMVVDDEPEIRQLLKILLTNQGYQVLEAVNGQEAVSLVSVHPEIDLILMDIMMPGLSGIDACKKIRIFTKAPLMFLTARNTVQDKEEAYQNGGDDYLPKPFSKSELLLKVTSLIRRYRVYGGLQSAVSSHGNAADSLLVDVRSRKVKKQEQEIKLTDKEMELLIFLLNHRGSIMDVKTLYEAVWKNKYMPSSDNNIMVYIQRLRKKLEDDPSNPTLIRTVYGRGYQID